MNHALAHVALLVADYDEAIAWFCGKLGFAVVIDQDQPEPGKRWVVIAPPGAQTGGCTILLARASTREQAACIGNQSGGRVFLFLATDDFWRDYNAWKSAGVVFVREPAVAAYGTVAVFEDLCGNRWDLIEYSPAR